MLGRHVGERADGRARPGERGLARHLRDAEVEQLDARGLVGHRDKCGAGDGLIGTRSRRLARAQEDVGRLDVAMNDAGLVRRGDATRDLDDDVEGLVNRRRPAGDPLLERLAFVIGHGQEHAAVGALVDLVDRADVRMIERRNRACFDQQALLGLLVLEQRQRQELQGDGAFEARVFGLVDLAHPSRAEEGQDAVVGDSVAEGHESSTTLKELCVLCVVCGYVLCASVATFSAAPWPMRSTSAQPTAIATAIALSFAATNQGSTAKLSLAGRQSTRCHGIATSRTNQNVIASHRDGTSAETSQLARVKVARPMRDERCRAATTPA